MNQSYRLLVAIFVLLVIAAVGVQRRSMTKPPTTQEEAVNRMLQSNTKVDEQLFAGTGSGVKTSRQASDTPSENIADDEFLDLYDQTKQENDPLRAYHLARALYQENADPQTVSLLIRRGIDVYDFSGTFALLKTFDEQGRLHEVITPRQFLYVLFNTLELTQMNLARIQQVITTYYEQGELDESEYTLYRALLAYARGETDTYISLVGQLQGTTLEDWWKRLETIKAQVYWFVDPPSYYIDGMIGLDLFMHGWYKLAVLGGDRVLKQDGRYILGEQLIAYGSFYLADRRRTYEALQRLKELDEQHLQLYLFLEGITLYALEDYPTALLALLQVKEPVYRTDTLRYLLLTYHTLDDHTKVAEVMKHLIRQSDVGAYDFFTVFDMFFFDPVRKKQEVVLFATHFELALQRLQSCYNEWKTTYAYVCLYGKAGLLLANGEESKAQTYLDRLVRLYPSAELYEKLGDIAYQQGNTKQAKGYFTQAVALSGPSRQQTTLTDKLQNIK